MDYYTANQIEAKIIGFNFGLVTAEEKVIYTSRFFFRKYLFYYNFFKKNLDPEAKLILGYPDQSSLLVRTSERLTKSFFECLFGRRVLSWYSQEDLEHLLKLSQYQEISELEKDLAKELARRDFIYKNGYCPIKAEEQSRSLKTGKYPQQELNFYYSLMAFFDQRTKTKKDEALACFDQGVDKHKLFAILRKVIFIRDRDQNGKNQP